MRSYLTDAEIVSLYWARDERAVTETARRYGTYIHAISVQILPYSSHNSVGCRSPLRHPFLRAHPPHLMRSPLTSLPECAIIN